MLLDFREQVWRTANGKSIRLSDMDLGHLVNVLNWTMDHGPAYSDRVRRALKQEAEYRRTFAFANREPYAGFVNNRWRIIDPETGAGTIEPPPKEYIDAVKDNEAYQRMSKQVQAKRRKMGV